MTPQERKVMEQALEALRMPCNYWNKTQFIKVKDAIAAIENLLAQPEQEPVAWVCHGVDGKNDIDFEQHEVDAVPVGTMLYTTPPQRTAAEVKDINLSCKSTQARLAASWGYVKAEPLTDEKSVELMRQVPHLTVGGLLAVEAKLRELNEAPAKQRREPLTKEQMYELSNKADDDWMRDGDSQAPWSVRPWTYHFVRAIEAAHGIGSETALVKAKNERLE